MATNMLRFTEGDYLNIYDLTFKVEGYAGYKPTVQESPNGDEVWDTEKKYAHVAPKYVPCPELMVYYCMAFEEACAVSKALRLPPRLSPHWNSCCLRILDYPPGAGSAEHTDFDLFTIQLYREHQEGFVRTGDVLETDDMISKGIHFGEMAEVAGIRKAMPHHVKGLSVRQRSIVFFVLPDPSAVLITAGEWLEERYARSRR